MSENAVFIFCHYFSPSGYYVFVETDGLKEDVESPVMYADGVLPCDGYVRITVSPGQHIFIDEYPGDDVGWQQHLIVMPEETQQFEDFEKVAERNAGLVVYERILGYKSRKGRFHPKERPSYDYTEDFGGGWLKPFITTTWSGIGDSNPQSLEEALKLNSVSEGKCQQK